LSLPGEGRRVIERVGEFDPGRGSLIGRFATVNVKAFEGIGSERGGIRCSLDVGTKPILAIWREPFSSGAYESKNIFTTALRSHSSQMLSFSHF
jgi:hypothetical protein